jgi:succinyl-CoA synthetase beta subunit
VVKAQVPTGKRGKAGGIKLAASPEEARRHAEAIIGMEIGEWPVEKVLIEAQTPFTRELYAAIINDTASRGPMLLFSPMGGMDVEEAAEQDPSAMRHLEIPITTGLDAATARKAIDGLGLDAVKDELILTLTGLYKAYRALDAELIEINPLVITADNKVVALDCKLTVDDSAAPRQEEIMPLGTGDKQTGLEAKAAEAGL